MVQYRNSESQFHHAFENDPYGFITLPRLVFIVTAHNLEDFIADCLKSVLNQEGEHWRCIVIDDASTDATWSIILDFMKLHPERIFGKRNLCRQWKMANFIMTLRFQTKIERLVRCKWSHAKENAEAVQHRV